jgi:hypothetical protein
VSADGSAFFDTQVARTLGIAAETLVHGTPLIEVELLDAGSDSPRSHT